MREKKRELARSTENREPIPFNPKTDFLPVNVNDLLSPFIACNELQRNVTNVVLTAAQGAFKLNFPPPENATRRETSSRSLRRDR